MSSVLVRYSETDVIKIITEFLENRGLGISQLAVERETGVINGVFSDDMLFVRQLILEGQWDDAIEFVEPLKSLEDFDFNTFLYVIYKHKFLELLCIKSDTTGALNYELTVEELVQCMNKLEEVCSSKEEYNALCLLLTLPKLSEHASYRHWNPSNARVECFKAVYKLIGKYMPLEARDKKGKLRSKDDRLIQLLLKGILYESCVEYCQLKATSVDKSTVKDIALSTLLSNVGLSEADMCLLSWLQALPNDTFAHPFEQKTLNVDVGRLDKPTLEASWSEQILMTPVRPNVFPYSAVPKARKVDLMSKSLNPQSDLSYSLIVKESGQASKKGGLVAQSHAAFSHAWKEDKKMDKSVDKLFETTTGKPSSSQHAVNGSNKKTSVAARLSAQVALPAVTSVAQKSVSPPMSPISRPTSVARVASTPTPTEPKFEVHLESSVDLYKEFQKQRKLFEEQMTEREMRRQHIEQELHKETPASTARSSAMGGSNAEVRVSLRSSQVLPSTDSNTVAGLVRTSRQRSLSVDRGQGQTDKSSGDGPLVTGSQHKVYNGHK
jgi:hypothetical protein